MWKKVLPAIVLTGLLLVGCNNNTTVPNKNETPMEDIRDDAREWKNDVERNIEGQNFDNNNNNVNGNGMDNGVNREETITNEVDTNRNGNNTQLEIIEDLNRKNNVH